jgi:carboxyl-terminal processing protease
MLRKSMRNTAHPPSIGRSILTGLLIGFGIAAVFAAGFITRDLLGGPGRVQAVSNPNEAGYPLLLEVQGLLDQHYLREQPDYAQRQYGAIRGMLTTLDDRFTFFIDPPVAQSESDVLAGTYGGIGVEIQRNEAGEILLYPFDDSPAARAGIVTGDVLLAINDTSVDLAMGRDAIDQALRGEVRDGNGVELTYRAVNNGEERTIFIAFEVINVPSIIYRVIEEDTRIGYMHILRFTSRTPEELRTALAALREEGIEALVVDLRNNSGGLLTESLVVTDEFVDGGALAYERNRDGEQAFNGTDGGAAIDLPMVVLINTGTASGAEIVAGAIQDSGRAILIGQQSYGKGSIQQIYPLADGSSLHVTAAEWLTPNRNQLDGAGLTPDIAMIPDVNGRDVELGEAVRQLQSELAEA